MFWILFDSSHFGAAVVVARAVVIVVAVVVVGAIVEGQVPKQVRL